MFSDDIPGYFPRSFFFLSLSVSCVYRIYLPHDPCSYSKPRGRVVGWFAKFFLCFLINIFDDVYIDSIFWVKVSYTGNFLFILSTFYFSFYIFAFDFFSKRHVLEFCNE